MHCGPSRSSRSGPLRDPRRRFQPMMRYSARLRASTWRSGQTSVPAARSIWNLLLKNLYRVRGSAEGLSVVDNAALGLTESGADAADWRPDDAVGDLLGALKPWCPPQPSIEPAAAAVPGKASTAGSERVFFPQGKTRAGLVAALDHLGFDLRYNERSSRLEILDVGAEHPTWNETDDMLRSSIRERIGERCSVFNKDKERVPMTLTSRRFVELTDAVLDAKRVDPFKEWLNGLPAWDKDPRLDLWLYGCFTIGEIDADLLKWSCYSVPMAAVWRADHPGEKHDEMVILVGPQGLGKSTVWAWLLPKEHRAQWFSDGLRFLAEPKAQVESLQGRVIVEASEMSGSTRADVENYQGVSLSDGRWLGAADLPPRSRPAAAALRHCRLDQRSPLLAE